jgi:hypothetical protein
MPEAALAEFHAHTELQAVECVRDGTLSPIDAARILCPAYNFSHDQGIKICKSAQLLSQAASLSEQGAFELALRLNLLWKGT